MSRSIVCCNVGLAHLQSNTCSRAGRASKTALTALVRGFDPDAISVPGSGPPPRPTSADQPASDGSDHLVGTPRGRGRAVEAIRVHVRRRVPGGPGRLECRRGAGRAWRRHRSWRRLPLVEDALRTGKLSGSQAVAVTDAASAAPCAQSTIGERCAAVESGRVTPGVSSARRQRRTRIGEATRARIHRQRYLRCFTDSEGARNLHLRGPVDPVARIEARLQPFIDDEFKLGSGREIATRNGRPTPSTRCRSCSTASGDDGRVAQHAER